MSREISQKEVCLTIKDGLIKSLSRGTPVSNTAYTEIKFRTKYRVTSPDIVERVKQILEKDGYTIFVPSRPRRFRFVAILDERFADIEIRENRVKEMYEYQILIAVPYNTIEYEFWYERFIKSI